MRGGEAACVDTVLYICIIPQRVYTDWATGIGYLSLNPLNTYSHIGQPDYGCKLKPSESYMSLRGPLVLMII